MADVQLHRGEIFYFTGPPANGKDNYVYIPKGVLVVSEGKILDVGLFDDLAPRYPKGIIFCHFYQLIMPGLIDSHVHFPQFQIAGMHANGLLDWLNRYTFPAEQFYADYPEDDTNTDANCFVNDLFRHGTTACMAYAATYPQTVDALFERASAYDMVMLTGKMMMNRNAPASLLDTTAQSEADTLRLIERWHGKGRNRYVISPRFAITSTNDQLVAAGRLHAAFSDTYIQTHLAESREEIANVKQLFPDCSDYLEVYEKADLLTNRSVLGHCVHLSDSEWLRMKQASAIVAHCPTSNLFLGSGLFPLRQANAYGVPVVLATDVAGGTTLSMFRTMDEAYKVQQLNGYPVTPLTFLYYSTLGAAKALGLDDEIGTFAPGYDADFIAVDYLATVDLERRHDHWSQFNDVSVEEKIIGVQCMGDDRCIAATYVRGKTVYERILP